MNGSVQVDVSVRTRNLTDRPFSAAPKSILDLKRFHSNLSLLALKSNI